MKGKKKRAGPAGRARTAKTVRVRSRRVAPRDTPASSTEQRLAEALEQQAATGEILRVIASSHSDVQPVFDTIAASAARLCESSDAAIYRRDGKRLVLVANRGTIPSPGPIGIFSMPLARGLVISRSVLDGRTIHVADAQAEVKRYPGSAEIAQRIGVRAMLSVPLMRDGVALGAIVLRRDVPHLFTDRQVQLLQTFADQAVIAIENVRLFTEAQAKNNALTESLEQQTATGEILRIISRSPTDVKPVFDTIVERAHRLCDG